MDLPPIPVGSSPPVVGPVAPQSPPGPPSPPGGQTSPTPQENTWVALAQAIIVKIPGKHVVRNLVKGPSRSEGADPFPKPQKSPEGEVVVGKDFIPKGFKPESAQAGPRPDTGGKPQAAQENAPLDRVVKEFSENTHTYSLKELKERISDVFARREPLKSEEPEKPPLPSALGMLPDRRYKLDDQKIPDKGPIEKPEEKEKVEEKERLGLGLTRETEDEDQTRPRDNDNDRVPIIEQTQPRLLHLEKITPQFLFGLNLTLSAAERITSSPAFKSAKVAVLVQGACEKLLMTHFLQFYGHLKKLVYVWELGHDTTFSDSWVFLGRLRMPCVALLDLELGRREGGWHQVKYLLRKMLAIQGGKLGDITEQEIAALPHWDSPVAGMHTWLALLERFGIFLSTPLDFDFMMLQAFSQAYRAEPGDPEAWKKVLDSSPESVEGYMPEEVVLLESYHKLFFLENRLVTHQEALRRMGPFDVVRLMPQVLGRLLNRLSVFAAR